MVALRRITFFASCRNSEAFLERAVSPALAAKFPKIAHGFEAVPKFRTTPPRHAARFSPYREGGRVSHRVARRAPCLQLTQFLLMVGYIPDGSLRQRLFRP
jgi:hypothetical protein